LLVLDEPFSGLDVLVREQLIECILERATETNVLLASHDLSEIESFASHIAYMDQGRLQFVEEMTVLSERFREVEVTLDHPVDLPQDWPAAWLNPEVSTAVVRFTDSRFDQCEPNQIRRHRREQRSIRNAAPVYLRGTGQICKTNPICEVTAMRLTGTFSKGCTAPVVGSGGYAWGFGAARSRGPLAYRRGARHGRGASELGVACRMGVPGHAGDSPGTFDR
jgi:energy-coupling factor transporter ATP-binding protein EcfA2